MDDDLLNDVAKILATQQDEQVAASQRTDELKKTLTGFQNDLHNQMKTQTDAKDALEAINLDNASQDQLAEFDQILGDMEQILTAKPTASEPVTKSKPLDSVAPAKDWTSLVQASKEYADRHELDLSNPYYQMMSTREFSELSTELVDKFQISRLQKVDYVFSSVVGVIMGLVDALLVGRIKTGKDATGLQKKVDQGFDKIVIGAGRFSRQSELRSQKAAAIKGAAGKLTPSQLAQWDQRIKDAGSIDKHRAIKTLEKNFKVSYDAANNASIIGDGIAGMSANNHHLRSLAHDPGILGLITGIVDQLTGRATFIDSTGSIVRATTTNMEKDGVIQGPLPVRIVKATENWFGHVLSDVAGSSGAKGRGAGVPGPFYVATQSLNVGSISIKGQNMTVAQTSDWLYKQGLDFRAFAAQSIPVLVGETLIRMYWFAKQHFYYGLPVQQSLPTGKNPDVNRLLLTMTSVFGALDFSDATVRSGFFQNMGEFLLRLNYVNALDLGFRSIQAMRNKAKHSQLTEKIDRDIQQEWNRILIP